MDNPEVPHESRLSRLSGAEQEDLVVPSHLPLVLPDLTLNLRVDPPNLLIHISSNIYCTVLKLRHPSHKIPQMSFVNQILPVRLLASTRRPHQTSGQIDCSSSSSSFSFSIVFLAFVSDTVYHHQYSSTIDKPARLIINIGLCI